MSDFVESEAEESEEEYNHEGEVVPRVTKKFVEEEDDDEEEYGKEEHEKEAIAGEIFQDEEGEEGQEAVEAPMAPPDEEEEDDEESDIDDFIVDDDGQPLKKPKWRKKLPGYTDAALQEAQEIFGVDFDYDEFEKYNEYDEELEEDYEYEDEGSDSGDSEDDVGHKKRKRPSFDDRLEDDDFDLIEENLGVKVKRGQKYRRVKKMSDDDETCRRIYNMEMARKINFLMRKNRADPWLGC